MGKSLKMKYIDLHTHRQKDRNVLEIKNIFAQEFPATTPNFFYSVGVHPWHINNLNLEECFSRIMAVAGEKNMLFVGECGIDRSIMLDIATQEECFKSQIQIADNCRKPLIIHCVRAYSDLIRIKKAVKSSIPWIIHGYNGNLEITSELVKHGFYFSVGDKFLKSPQKNVGLKHIPNNRIFFETDESLTSIEEIYQLGSVILGTDKSELISMIWDNFSKISKIELDSIF